MSERWQGALAGIAAGALLNLLLWRLGFYNWWGRRRYLAQVLLILAIALALISVIILFSLLLQLTIDFVGGLLLGAVWCVVFPLLAGTRPVRRLRGVEEADERDSPPAL